MLGYWNRPLLPIAARGTTYAPLRAVVQGLVVYCFALIR
jgi:hypothetical protein